MLLRNRYRHIVSGPLHAGYWLGLDPEAVAIARASGDEEAYARTLEPIEWRTRQETDAVLAIARTWVQPAAIMRALDVVGRDLIYRHGDFPRGRRDLHELLGWPSAMASIPAQAEALTQITTAHLGLGDLFCSRQSMDRSSRWSRRSAPNTASAFSPAHCATSGVLL